MRIEPIIPDTAGSVGRQTGDANAGFTRVLDAAGRQLEAADAAEAAFAQGHGGLQEMVVARARADVTLAVAAAGAQRAAQALNTLLGMQI